MKLSLYLELREIIPTCRSRRQLKRIVGTMYPEIDMETIFSIYSQEYQRKMKMAYHKHNSSESRALYYEQFFERTEKKEDPEKHTIVKMAQQYDLSPCMLARILLDVFLEQNPRPKQFDPAVAKRTMISQMFKHPHKIGNLALAKAVHEAVIADEHYGPFPDNIKRLVGFEHENKLKKWCIDNKIDFLSEDDMRKEGYDKTPDIKLIIPVAVDGYPINWIESKASFGDEESHTNYVRDQLGPYTNRFGPGLVIYWFGFIDALDCQREHGIAVSDSLPKTVEKISFKLWEENLDWEFPKAPRWDHCDF